MVAGGYRTLAFSFGSVLFCVDRTEQGCGKKKVRPFLPSINFATPEVALESWASRKKALKMRSRNTDHALVAT